ncbi:hypothetical protein [Gemmata sp.]|uniref:hypothetical protein n=1 Tax=Gemmata sp. TaxID=1914242 RepID=UPI003F6F41AD
MFAASQSFLHALLTSAVFFCGTGTVSANWFTIKNDTGKAIVVQEMVVVNGQVRRGKPTVLLAGETLREFIPGPTVKRIEVFDQQNQNQATWSGNLGCKDENQTYSVGLAGGKVVVGQVVPPKK